jgi:hypothetical protein
LNALLIRVGLAAALLLSASLDTAATRPPNIGFLLAILW